MRFCRVELALLVEEKCQARLDICNFCGCVDIGRDLERSLKTTLRFLQVTEHVIGVTGIQRPVNLQAGSSYFLCFLFRQLKIGKSFLKITQVEISKPKISRGHFKGHPCPYRSGNVRGSSQKG